MFLHISDCKKIKQSRIVEFKRSGFVKLYLEILKLLLPIFSTMR